MRDKDKAALAVGGLGLFGLAIYLAMKAKAAPPEGPAAAVKIVILDADGIPVPASSPVILDEGAPYTVMTSVTNKTTRAGSPWEADLETWVMAIITDGVITFDLIPYDIFPSHYLAGSIGYFYSPLVIPDGYGGWTGAITANVFDPNDNLLATDTELLTVRSMALIYGASVTVGIEA